MKLKKYPKIKSYNNFKLHFIDNNNILLNKTFEDSLSTKNSQIKYKKNFISLLSLKNKNKLILNNIKNNNNETILNKNQNLSSIEKLVKNRNKNKFKMIKICTGNNDINKLLINSYSHSLNNKDQYNTNSLNYISINNLKESFYPINSIKEKNMNTFKNIIDTKNNSFSLKNQFSLLKNKIKFKEKQSAKKENLRISEPENDNFSHNSKIYLTEENKENINNNFNNIFLNNNNINKQIHYIKKNNDDFYLDDYIINNTNNKINNDEYNILIKKYYILLEEKNLYKKKANKLQKENKGLKEEIKNKNKKINDMVEINNINKNLRKENDILKLEINNLKNKLNEMKGNKNNNEIIKDKIDEKPLSYINSFCCSFPGNTMPTTERYIKKLEKENEELSNKILKYKNMFKFSHK